MTVSCTCLTAIVFLITSITAQSYGTLVVLRQPATRDGRTRNLTCVSENDGSALIWNYNYQPIGFHKEPRIVQDFQPRILGPNTDPMCAVWKAGRCIGYWKMEGQWNLVNSAERPMGPVLDYRWEGFKEFVTEDNLDYQYVGKVQEPFRSVVFSARGQEIYILLCDTEDSNKSACFRIVIGSKTAKETSIWTCDSVRTTASEPETQQDCENVDTHWQDDTIVESYEWRTFRMEWARESYEIKLFQNTDAQPFLKGHVYKKVPGSHILFRSNIRSSRVKFHFYQYFLTEQPNMELFTTEIQWYDRYFCLEMLFGLCPTCTLQIDLIDYKSNLRISGTDTFHVSAHSVHDELLSWQPISITAALPHPFPNRIKLKIRTILKEGSDKGRWAVGTFRVCESAAGELRESTITVYKDVSTETAIWPQVNCQKLSYRHSAVVDTLSTSMIYDDTSGIQKITDSLAESCDECPRLNEKWSICSSSGCACNRGFGGTDCAQRCPDFSYGYNCNMKCGSCREGYCDKISGRCNDNKCKDQKLLPPICKELEQPNVTLITDTTAEVFQNVEREAVRTIDSVTFSIKAVAEQQPGMLSGLLTGWSTYGAKFIHLQPNTTYIVKTIVSMTEPAIELESREITFTTTSLGPEFGLTAHLCSTCTQCPQLYCVSGASCFKVNLQTNSIELDWRYEVKECGPLPVGYYWLELKNPKRQWSPAAVQGLPFVFHDLKPYTEYNLTVSSSSNAISLIKNVRTLESAPGKVGHLRWLHLPQTEVTLSWAAPIDENGVIRKYSVSLERIKLKGCGNAALPQNKMSKDVNANVNDEITASFSNLNPYASYMAIVVAYTTVPGTEAALKFDTAESDIPTSVVSHLTFVENQNRLQWDEPEDCTTISGYAKRVKLLFEGVSEWAKTWSAEKSTANDYFDLKELKLALRPYTTYRVRVYVTRKNHINVNLYKEVTWTTAPSAPPRVMNSTVYEADPDSNTISLRWKPPHPANGEIESYHVLIHEGGIAPKDYTIKVPEEIRLCEPAENDICFENVYFSPDNVAKTHVEIYAKNKGISQQGESTFLRESLDFYYNQAPGAPENLTAIDQGQGVVTLTWLHPSFSSTKIKQFRIVVKRQRTNLLVISSTSYTKTVNYIVTQKQQDYSMVVFLEPSANYLFSIVAINGREVSSPPNERVCSITGSIGFVSEKESQVTFDGSTIEINIPKIINATQNTTVEVIVKGPSSCTPHQAPKSAPLLNSTKFVTEWVAAIYQVNNMSRDPLKIGSDPYQAVDAKCSLDLNKMEAIVFVVKDWYSGKSIEFSSSPFQKEPTNKHFIWLIIFLLIAVCTILLFIGYRRYRKPLLKRSQQNILQLEPTAFGIGESTAPSTMKSTMTIPDEMVNGMSISQPSPNAVPKYNPNSCPVKVEKFEEYVQEALGSGLLDSQYENLPRSVTKPCNHAALPENVPKNRYKDRVPYDETRVVLEKISRVPHSDYINASYLQGYRKKKAYIATQGPKPTTINDFWRMIWQEKAQVLCMLANVIEGGKKKCEQYWPEVGAEEKYADILVSHKKNQVFAEYTIRTFSLVCRKETRQVTHLHYTGWPDHGVPMYTQSLVAYLKKLLATSTGSGPVVVHCSAGVGRTGTIILCDICLRQAIAERIIDVPGTLVKMRGERANMVDNAQQYLLAHLAIMESMVVKQTQLNCNSSLIQKIMELRKQLPSDIHRLNDTVWQDRVLHCLRQPGHQSQGDARTNLSPVSPTIDHSRLSSTIVGQSNSIDFVEVIGVKMKNQFLATQLPSKSSLSDIWTLIMEKKIELVVVLQRPSPKDPTSCDIVPADSTLDPTPNLQVERKSIPEVADHFTIDKLFVTDKSTQAAPQLPVTVITCTEWEPGKHGKPPTAAKLVSLWMASEKIPRKEGQTLVLCHDGVTGCGLYLALSFLLERMAVERECDVISAVRAVRRSRTKFVESLNQFEYLYDAAVDYAKCFEIYANFS